MKQDEPYSFRFPLPGPPPEGEGVNRPNGRSIRLSAVTGSHRFEPVEYSHKAFLCGESGVYGQTLTLGLRGIAGLAGSSCLYRQRDRLESGPQRAVFFPELDKALLQDGDILLLEKQQPQRRGDHAGQYNDGETEYKSC